MRRFSELFSLLEVATGSDTEPRFFCFLRPKLARVQTQNRGFLLSESEVG
ncbi:Uncharacterised protein [Cytobacillus firmus]|nr:Uncharacterised protein [Cytobacillus firmus]